MICIDCQSATPTPAGQRCHRCLLDRLTRLEQALGECLAGLREVNRAKRAEAARAAAARDALVRRHAHLEHHG